MNDATLPESLDALSDHELLERWRTRSDLPARRALFERHGPALHQCFAGFGPGAADLVGDALHRFVGATPSRAELDHPGLLLCRVAFEVLAGAADDPVHVPTRDTAPRDGSELQLLELALERLPPRDRAAILLHHHSAAASPELDADDVDERIRAPLARANDRLHSVLESLRAEYRVRPPST